MKALNFLQMWFLNVSERHIYDAWLRNILSKNHTNLTDWAHFLNQKFEPEMIEEYFEGFDEFYYYDSNEYQIRFNYGVMYIDFVKTNTIYDYPIPSTLDRFISDCQEAGIELKLKEQNV